MPFPILQFGTSRFLQAHADLFVSEALAKGEAAGKIAVVQTTSSPDSRRRLAFFNEARPYRVHVRGLAHGKTIDEWVEVSSIGRGIDANLEWEALEALFVDEARWVISNTGDRGYELDAADRLDGPVPRSFPAKLTKLLHRAFSHGARAAHLAAVRTDRRQWRQAESDRPRHRARDGGSRKPFCDGLARSASGSIRWSTASSRSRSSPPAPSPSPMLYGRSSASRGSKCPAFIPLSSSPTISRATSG